MELNLVSAFVNETNCDHETAFEYLQANCWDLDLAIESWQHLNDHREITNEERSILSQKHEVKKLSRGISRVTENVNLISRVRCEFAEKFPWDLCPKGKTFSMATPIFTFTLPDLNIYGDEFRTFLEKDLIENSTLISLEQSGRLNWWVENGPCQRLWPLSTTGDGNCLLHAASLAIWGFHDRLLTLRRALHNYLESSVHIHAFYRRWRWQQTKVNEQAGFTCSEAEWYNEWQNIISMASIEPRKNANNSSGRFGETVTSTPSSGADYTASTYESLEEIHVLVLAHVLRRPIIVVADTMLRDMNNEPFAPIPFGGIYLPMEFPPKDCHRSPVLLAYDMAHFSALVAMENVNKEKLDKLFAVIPLVDSEGMLLPVQFCADPGLKHDWFEKPDQALINSLLPNEKDQISLIKKYLDVVDLSENDAVSPDNDSEEDIEKRFIEVTDLSDGENTLFSSKNRAAKQLQSVARQFGSIGKSMSKKLKKNFGSITKVAIKPKKSDSRRMLCAEIHHMRHAHQDEMVKNYLIYAQKRFLHKQRHKLAQYESNPDNLKLQEQALIEGPLKCINAHCISYGTVLTSYMCEKCYESQRNEELSKINVDSRTGTGRSKFYRDSDMESYDAIKNIPVTKSNMNSNRTLYLSKSTFYYDNNESPDIDKEIPAIKSKTNSKIPGESSSVLPVESSEVRHISKFDFGNINHNISKFDFGHINHNINTNSLIPGNSSLEKKNDMNEPDFKYNSVSRLDKEHIGSSPVLDSIQDINKNRSVGDESINNIIFDMNDISLPQSNTIDAYSKMSYSTALKRCKFSNCANLASANTNFYCTDCNKKNNI